MGRLYQRNQDDQFMDPEIQASRYKIGRSIFFEVELAMAERDSSSFSSGSSSQSITNALGYEASGGSGGVRIGCPEENQFIWVNKDSDMRYILAIRAKSLLKSRRDYFLYNPISGRFNKLKRATLFKDVELIKFTTASGIEARSSLSHKIIRNTADVKGQFLMNHVQGTEMLIVERHLGKHPKEIHRYQYNLHTDIILKMKKDGIGNCIEIELEEEFIYANGTNPNELALAHNRKDIGVE